MTDTRYALYYVPPADTDWASFTTAWLGWDVCAGRAVAHPDVADLPLPIADISQTPRRYGLHATLKPPFRLADGATELDLADACAVAFANQRPVRLDTGLALQRLGRFLALRPPKDTPALTDLASHCVRALDDFRAAPSASELARRRHRRLTPGQEANLTRWGYPYVMDAFRFHITLTGRLPEPDLRAVQGALDRALTPLLPSELIIREVALVHETADGWFHLVQRYALSG